MSYRLLLDIEAVEFMAALPRREQLQLRRRLGEMQADPPISLISKSANPAGVCSMCMSIAASRSISGTTLPTVM